MRKYSNNIYSQNGEDGIIEEILKRLDIDVGFTVEFGAADGKWFSNTYNLVENKGWSAFYIEGDDEKAKELFKLRSDKISTSKQYVTSSGDNSLNEILKDVTKIDLLSIDVDGEDYHIWKAFDRQRPKIVIIEVNSSIPVGQDWIHDKNHQGTSFTSMLKLGIEKGYDLVCHTGNMIFVRTDLTKGKFDDIELNSANLFETKFLPRR